MSLSDHFYTVGQAADCLGCSGGRIRQLLGDGTLSGEKVGEGENSPWMLPKYHVEEFAKIEQKTGRPRRSAPR